MGLVMGRGRNGREETMGLQIGSLEKLEGLDWENKKNKRSSPQYNNAPTIFSPSLVAFFFFFLLLFLLTLNAEPPFLLFFSSLSFYKQISSSSSFYGFFSFSFSLFFAHDRYEKVEAQGGCVFVYLLLIGENKNWVWRFLKIITDRNRKLNTISKFESGFQLGIMMRYQRVSPDCLPLTNGSKKTPYLRPSPSKSSNEAGRGFNGGSCTTTTTTNSSLDGVPKGFRFRSTQQQGDDDDEPSPIRRGGDVLLQWGQRKRSRISRTEIRSTTTTTTTTADDSSSSSGQVKMTKPNKLLRRSVNPFMPPPPHPSPPPPIFSAGRSTNLRKGFVGGKESSSGFFPSRNLEDRSTNGSPSRNNNNNINGRMMSSRSGGSKRSPPSPQDQIEKRSSVRDHHHQSQRQNGLDHYQQQQQHQRGNRSESMTQGHVELETNNNGERDKTVATQVEVMEWPRIYIALSRKEKEEDFLVMKGTKLPHRPRKRAKNIDKALQYCFPGMWLSDLTKTRYEVREKKNVKKQPKRRGLKGMENLDTDSD